MLQYRPSDEVGQDVKHQGTGAICEALVMLVGKVVVRVEVNWKAVVILLTISTISGRE
jgi:hypothetical protein